MSEDFPPVSAGEGRFPCWSSTVTPFAFSGTEGGQPGQRSYQKGTTPTASPTGFHMGSATMELPRELRDTPKASSVAFFHTDHLGTPLRLSDAAGQTIWQGEPDDWAAIAKEQGSTSQSIRFQGQWEDEETGLYYNRYRYYDPARGSYITQDPIGLRGGMNLTGYVRGDPIGLIDPTGLDSYIVNRDLSALGDSARSRLDPLTHTFIAVTGPDGAIAHTYSWGNAENLRGWNIDKLLDMKTASEAVSKNFAEKVGGLDMDRAVSEAYKNLNVKK